MDELMIFGLVAAGLYVLIDGIVLCVNLAREKKDRKNKEDMDSVDEKDKKAD